MSAHRTGTIGSPTHNLRGPTGMCSGPITFLHCHRLDPMAHDIATRDHRTRMTQPSLLIHLPTTQASSCLSNFSEAAGVFGLRISWPKTEIQNVGSGPQPPSILVDRNPVDSVSTFTYLGSLQSSMDTADQTSAGGSLWPPQ